jgi:hypothetical protein
MVFALEFSPIYRGALWSEVERTKVMAGVEDSDDAVDLLTDSVEIATPLSKYTYKRIKSAESLAPRTIRKGRSTRGRDHVSETADSDDAVDLLTDSVEIATPLSTYTYKRIKSAGSLAPRTNRKGRSTRGRDHDSETVAPSASRRRVRTQTRSEAD